MAKWYFNQIATTSGVGTNRWLKYKIEQLPIPLANAQTQKILTDLVDKVLSRRKINADTLATECEIDAFIIQLYGLSIVDGSFILKSCGVTSVEHERTLSFITD